MISIIKKTAVPEFMLASDTPVEVEMIRSIKFVQTVHCVLRGVTMHDIEKDRDAEAMCCINKLLQIFWGPEAAASCEEAVDLVPKAGIVCVLHDGHQLNDIVS